MTPWRNPKPALVLASQSPRRKDILQLMGLAFEVVPPAPIDEPSFFNGSDLKGSIQRLATAKALSVISERPGALVLGADTIVVKDGRVLGKPASRQEGAEMLSFLSDSTHEVITGVALICPKAGFAETGIAVTEVIFRKIQSDEIEFYLGFDEYRDKAGAYAIQGRAMSFIEAIHGCYYNVVGLPVSETIRLLSKFVEHRSRT